MKETCNSICRARKSLSKRLKAQQHYPRPTGGAVTHHKKTLAKVLVERSVDRCTYAGCTMSAAVGHETAKSLMAGELMKFDMPDVSSLVVRELERKAANLADRMTVTRDRILRETLLQTARNGKHRR